MRDFDKEIAAEMDNRRHHLACAQEIDRIPIMAAAKLRHEKIARECGERIRALCAERRKGS